jgi:hypothetical protein
MASSSCLTLECSVLPSPCSKASARRALVLSMKDVSGFEMVETNCCIFSCFNSFCSSFSLDVALLTSLPDGIVCAFSLTITIFWGTIMFLFDDKSVAVSDRTQISYSAMSYAV